MSVSLSPFAGAGWQFFDNNGVILSGGKLYVYGAGSVSLATTYTNVNGITANTNPIILNASGRLANEIWLTNGLSYKFILKDVNDVLIGTWDNIPASENGAFALQTALAASTGATLVGFTGANNIVTTVAGLADNSGSDLIGYTQGGTSAVTTTVQNKLRETVSVKDFGAVGDGVTNDTFAIQAAVNTSKSVYFPIGTYLCSDNIVVSSAVDTESHKLYGDGRESILLFSSGGLVFSGKAGKNSCVEKLQIKMSGSSQVGLSFVDTAVTSAPTRWVMRDIWVISSNALANTGIKLQGGWIGTISNAIIQSCDIGVQIVKSVSSPFVSFNSLSFTGGEIQGNTTGVDAESVLGLSFFGTAIEGNKNNGVLLRSGCRNVTFDSAYFEGNGVSAPSTSSDVRINVTSSGDTLYSVMFHNCSFLSASGAQDAIWANKCFGLVIDEGCSFNGYTNRLNIQDISVNMVTGNFKAIAPSTAISWTNNSNAFGATVIDEYSMNGLSMPDAVTTTSADLSFTLPSTAAKLGSITLMYTTAAAGNVYFRITPYDIATGTATAPVNAIVTPALIGRNISTAAFNFDSRSLRGKDVAFTVARLGGDASDTNTGTVTLNTVKITSYQ